MNESLLVLRDANYLEFTQHISNNNWGIKFLGYKNLSVSIEYGSGSGNVFGSGLGDDSYKDRVNGIFDIDRLEPYVLCMKGYDIDTDYEVSISINGVFKGYLRSRVNNQPRTTCLNIDSSWLIVGRNYVNLHQATTGETWGVEFLSMMKVATIMVPIINSYIGR